jgi:hypothetical protein
MFKAIGLCVIGGALLACSSNSTAACGAISGSYTDSETSAASNASCSVPVSPAGGITSGTITVTGAGPDHEVTIPSVQGSCPALSNGCSLDVQCTINLTDASGNPAGTATLSTDWNFTTTGFSGTSTVVLKKSDGSSCTLNFDETASKQ